MSEQLIGIVSGSVHFVLSLFLALLTTYGSFRLFDRLTRDVDEVRELRSNNIAVGVLLGAMLLSSAIIVRQATVPVISTLQTFLYHEPSWLGGLRLCALAFGYIVLTLLIAVGSIWIAFRAFLSLTRNLDEIAEVKRNNVAVAITLGFALLVMGMFLADGIGSLLNALVPFPAVQQIEVYGI